MANLNVRQTAWTFWFLIIGHPGGATPGKFLMGLRIYTCDQVKYKNRDTTTEWRTWFYPAAEYVNKPKTIYLFLDCYDGRA